MKKILLIIAALCLCSLSYAQNAGDFTLKTQVNGDNTLTPTLTWNTSPEATNCVASGDAAWEGPKAGSGTVTLDPFPTSTPKSYGLVCYWPDDTQALLTWTAPTEYTDGTTLTNLAGYRVFWGQAAGQLTETAQVNDPAATSYTVTNLSPATWYFGIRAFTTQGAESAMSDIVSKTTSAAVEWTQQTGVKVPKAPGVGIE